MPTLNAHCCAGLLLWSRHLVLVASSLLTAGCLLLQAGCCLLAIALERGLLCRSAAFRFVMRAAILTTHDGRPLHVSLCEFDGKGYESRVPATYPYLATTSLALVR